MSDYQKQMEFACAEYFRMKDELDRLKHNMELQLDKMNRLMIDEKVTSFSMALSEDREAFVERRTTRRKMLNKDELASDLGVEKKSTLTTPFLLGCVEQRKLTSDQFQKYYYYENPIKISARAKKPKKKKAKKNRG